MGHQLVFISEPSEIEADHLVCAKRWLFTSPQCDQHTSDNRAIGLNLNSVLIRAQQVPTTKHVLEEAEENSNRPTLGEDQADHIGGNVEQVRGDSQNAVAVDSA